MICSYRRKRIGCILINILDIYKKFIKFFDKNIIILERVFIFKLFLDEKYVVYFKGQKKGGIYMNQRLE